MTSSQRIVTLADVTTSTVTGTARRRSNFSSIIWSWTFFLAYSLMIMGLGGLAEPMPKWAAYQLSSAGFGVIIGGTITIWLTRRQQRKALHHQFALHHAAVREAQADYDAAVQTLIAEIGDLAGGLPRSATNIWAYCEHSLLLDPTHPAAQSPRRNVVAVGLIRSVPPTEQAPGDPRWTLEILMEEQVPICDAIAPRELGKMLIGTGQEIVSQFQRHHQASTR